MTIPIACSLTASDYRRRLGELGALARDTLRTRVPIAGGARLTFTSSTDTRERLGRLIAAESACCPFLAMDLRDTGDALVLDVTGSDDAAPIIAELFAAPVGEGGRASGG